MTGPIIRCSSSTRPEASRSFHSVRLPEGGAIAAAGVGHHRQSGVGHHRQFGQSPVADRLVDHVQRQPPLSRCRTWWRTPASARRPRVPPRHVAPHALVRSYTTISTPSTVDTDERHTIDLTEYDFS